MLEPTKFFNSQVASNTLLDTLTFEELVLEIFDGGVRGWVGGGRRLVFVCGGAD